MTMTYETVVLVRVSQHIGVVTLKRAGGFNALNNRIGQEGLTLLDSFAMDANGLRSLIPTGDGDKAFCA